MHEKSLPIYVQATPHFSLPDDNSAHIIMIGSGTGIAPFQSFVQERIAVGATGRNWLFFGERRRQQYFYYEDYWSTLVKDNQLKLTTAFSQDQDYKIYVQNRMIENASELWSWIENGAYIYVCGDAQHMAKGVEEALLQIVTEKGHMPPEEAHGYIKRLKSQKRYLRDVY